MTFSQLQLHTQTRLWREICFKSDHRLLICNVCEAVCTQIVTMGLQSNNLQCNTRLLFDLQALCLLKQQGAIISRLQTRIVVSKHLLIKAGNTRRLCVPTHSGPECHDPNVIDKTSMCGAAETTKLDTS